VQPNEPLDALCVVTPCFNDFAAFEGTLASLRGELCGGDELVVVDSSIDREIVPRLVAAAGLQCAVRTHWQPPRGVYAALNAGIEKARLSWIQIINSGDGLLPGARAQIARVLRDAPEVAIHVFRQQAEGDTVEPYVFTPNARSVWPHQSIILARRVHESLGLYDTRCRLTADQLFFAHARREFTYQFHQFVLTRYDVQGMSSVVSRAASRELYGMWRALGRGRLDSCIRAWVKPALRGLAQQVLGQGNTHALKRALFSHYRKQEPQ
jgi:glycosyltransferase involved in cell wall biosynthesis